MVPISHNKHLRHSIFNMVQKRSDFFKFVSFGESLGGFCIIIDMKISFTFSKLYHRNTFKTKGHSRPMTYKGDRQKFKLTIPFILVTESKVNRNNSQVKCIAESSFYFKAF